MFHEEAVSGQLLEILTSLEQIPQLEDTRLVGGTALAMQTGHRISVDIVDYPHPWLEPALLLDGHRVAALADIAAMKLAAIAGRGSRKDFIDIYFLLESFSLEEMLRLYERKFKTGSRYIVLKSLTWFEDAQSDLPAHMLVPVSFDQVADRILDAVSRCAR